MKPRPVEVVETATFTYLDPRCNAVMLGNQSACISKDGIKMRG